jgi:hypothetical protein
LNLGHLDFDIVSDLELSISYFASLGLSTLVESALQIHLFMQNKAKLRKSQMNVNNVLTMFYDRMDTWWSGKKQSQTNPNKAKLKKAKINVTTIITAAYENKPPIWVPKKQTQTSKRQKPMQTSLPKRIMKKTAFSGYDKTNPNKANFKDKKLFQARSLKNHKFICKIVIDKTASIIVGLCKSEVLFCFGVEQ